MTSNLALKQQGTLIAGVDEAGRGPLAGPVVAAAVILDPQNPITGLKDSKKISVNKREQLFTVIQQHALAWAIAQAEVAEIDEINILQASLLAMRRAVAQLTIQPTKVLVDGNTDPQLSITTETVIKGDQKIAAISAASILAKVFRDRLMITYHQQYPDYGFNQHKGYPTAAHMNALIQFGVTPIHRRSFAPVKKTCARS